MRNLFLITGMIFLLLSCTQAPENSRTVFRPPSLLKDYECDFTDYIKAPKGYTKKAELTSNLDDDTIQETSVILESTTAVGNKKEREIRIFKKRDGKFVLWQTIKGGLLPNDLDTEFDDDRTVFLLNDDRELEIFHYGGPRGDGMTYYPQMAHAFQLKSGKWRLKSTNIITSETDGDYDYVTECDYDAETGRLTYERTADFNYNSDSTHLPPKEVRAFSFPLKERPLLEGFVPGLHVVPGTKAVYL